MNPKVEKLFKLPLYQRLLMLSVLLILIAGVFVWFLWLPQYEEIGKLKAEGARLGADWAQKKKIANDLPRFKTEFAKMETKLQAALTQLPNKKEIPTLLTNLATLAKENGLDVKSFSPKKEVSKGFFAEVPAALILEGTYHQIAEFTQSVGELQRIVNISDLNMSGPKTQAGEAILKVTCKVTTFRFIDK